MVGPKTSQDDSMKRIPCPCWDANYNSSDIPPYPSCYTMVTWLLIFRVPTSISFHQQPIFIFIFIQVILHYYTNKHTINILQNKNKNLIINGTGYTKKIRHKVFCKINITSMTALIVQNLYLRISACCLLACSSFISRS